MIDPDARSRTLAALLLAASLGVPPLQASAHGVGFAPGGTVLAAGLFDFLGAGRLRAKLADAQRRQAQAEAATRAARADATRARATLVRERAEREREHARYGRALTQLAAYGRDADEQRAQVARLQARLAQETAIARALRRRFSATERRLADATAPKGTGLDAAARGRRHHRTGSTSVGWGAI